MQQWLQVRQLISRDAVQTSITVPMIAPTSVDAMRSLATKMIAPVGPIEWISLGLLLVGLRTTPQFVCVRYPRGKPGARQEVRLQKITWLDVG